VIIFFLHITKKFLKSVDC